MGNDRITDFFEAHREEMLTRLASLCAIPSVMGAPQEGMPYGIGVDTALRAAEAMFREDGFATERDPEGRYFLATYGEGERTLGLFAHADVVPAGDGWTLTAPFEPLRRDGLLIARGADDNKTGIISSLYLLRAVRELSLPIDGVRLLVFVGGNEESGMSDIEAFCAAHPAPDVSIVPDNSFPLSLGEKGRVTAWLVSPPMLSDVLSINGGMAFNAVLDRATATLAFSPALAESLREAISGREDISMDVDGPGGRITLTARGRSAHAAAPKDGINAGALLTELLSACPCLSADERGVLASASIFLSSPYGGALGIAGDDGPFYGRTTVNGMIRTRGGRIFLSQDIRYGAALHWEEDLAPLVEEGVDAEEWEIIIDSATDGFDLGDDAPLAARLLDAFRRLTGNEQAMPYRSLGGTYARHLPAAYSVGTSVDRARPALIPEGHGGAHAPDEYICEDSLLASLRILTEYVTTSADFLRNE